MFRRGSQTKKYFTGLCENIDVSLSTGKFVVDLEPETHHAIREWRDLTRVIKMGLVKADPRTSMTGELTPKGLAYALVLCLERRYRLLPKKQVCLVVFDIPERHRQHRSMLRRLMKELKFTALQRSVFVSRQDAAEHLQYYLKLTGLARWVRVYTAISPVHH